MFVDPTGSGGFDDLHYLGDRDWMPRKNEAMPMVWHQDIAAKEIPKPSTGDVDDIQNHLELSLIQISTTLKEVASDEKDFLRKT
jgi:hypothetical protein